MQYYLTESDLSTLKEMFKWWSTIRRRVFQPVNLAEENGAPEVYLALTTVEIAALDRGADIGTGTGATFDDIISYGTAQVYQITEDGVPYAVTDRIPTIYSLYPVAIPLGTWCIITRDKFGKWIISTAFFDVNEC